MRLPDAIFRPHTLLRRNILWNTAVYVEGLDYSPTQPLQALQSVFTARRVRRRLRDVRNIADPFLHVVGSELFLFLEVEPADGPGRIEGYRTTDLKTWKHVGEVLREPHHLSYPYVFDIGEDTFLIPESAEGGEVALYRFGDFPHGLQKVRVLLQGFYVDSWAINVENRWYLFTTSEAGLEIFFTEDLLAGALTPHPMNPVATDPRYRRSGGRPPLIDGKLFRFAQDCSQGYGDNLHLLEIVDLSPEAFCERLVKSHLFDCAEAWNSLGGHHMSISEFNGRMVVAVDGKQYDYYIHKVRGLIRRLTGW